MGAKIKNPHHTSTRHRHKPKGVSGKAFEKVYWPYIPVIILIGFVLAATVQNGLLSYIVKHPTNKVLAFATSLSSTQLLADTNNARQANKVKPLSINEKLADAAQAKANDMATKDYWSHYTPSGNAPWVFVDAQSYQYNKLGENLATGFKDSQATIDGWMASPEHKENMLDTAYSEVGFGYANIANYNAAGGGPMTIVVAFYGQPVVEAAATPTRPNNLLSTGSSGNLPSQTISTSRANLAFASLPLSNYATVITVCGLALVAGVWIGRHALRIRRAFAYGESFVISHPMMDLGLLFLGMALFALTRTAGLII